LSNIVCGAKTRSFKVSARRAILLFFVDVRRLVRKFKPPTPLELALAIVLFVGDVRRLVRQFVPPTRSLELALAIVLFFGDVRRLVRKFVPIMRSLELALAMVLFFGDVAKTHYFSFLVSRFSFARQQKTKQNSSSTGTVSRLIISRLRDNKTKLVVDRDQLMKIFRNQARLHGPTTCSKAHGH
jgi:CBS-domain-containing membrane protein